MKSVWIALAGLSASFLMLSLTRSGPQDPQDPQEEKEERAALEKAFAEKLSGCELVGSYTIDEGPNQTEAPKFDKYTLEKVVKQEDGRWRFETVIHYGGRDIKGALPLQVLWAGDTPVITVDDFKVPGLGAYSARVVFHGDRYAGTWQGKGYGGHLWGRIVRQR